MHLYLDEQPPQDIYDLDQPIVFDDLEPGTHTLRVFAVRPWQESFKNAGAYAESSFNVFTPTPGHTPAADQPVLTYSSPRGRYGAEPILLDFYLANAPLHLVAQEDPDDAVRDWRVRVTVNNQSFTLNEWQPVYLQGFQPGTNWLKLELIDEDGLPLGNSFNATARLITYDPDFEDAIAQLTRGELSVEAARGIVEPGYQPPAPEPSKSAVSPTDSQVTPPEPPAEPEAPTTPELTEDEPESPPSLPEPADESESTATSPETSLEPEISTPSTTLPVMDEGAAADEVPAMTPESDAAAETEPETVPETGVDSIDESDGDAAAAVPATEPTLPTQPEALFAG
ncbi:MAG: hypothetical protein HC838_13900 [Spirulinaceae cyanobacterium RM2_2_10]|nr:hypothetical protein [Spirulinaceae cyanobacterium RM2_2_10]